jgi:hypothetical protein
VQVIAAESPRVIVTPFESFGLETPELDEIAAGMTEEIMLALGRLDVRVIAAEPRWLDSGRVGEMSSRDYVLSGSVRPWRRRSREWHYRTDRSSTPSSSERERAPRRCAIVSFATSIIGGRWTMGRFEPHSSAIRVFRCASPR